MKASDPALDIRLIWNHSIRQIRDKFYPLLIFGALFYAVSASVLIPLRAGILALLIETTGDAAISNADIARFLITLPGVLSIAILVISSLGLLVAQQAGVVLIAARPVDRVSRDTLAILQNVLWKLPDLFAATGLQATIVGIYSIPFLATGWLGYTQLIGDHDINFYLSNWPPEFLIAIAVAVVIGAVWAAGVVFFLVRTSLTIPLCAIDQYRWSTPIRGSWNRTAGHGLPIAISLILWAFSGVALIMAASFLVLRISGLIVGILPASIALTIGVSASLMVVIDGLLTLFVYVVGCGYGLIVWNIYSALTGRTRHSDQLPSRATPLQPRRWRWSWVAVGLVGFLIASAIAAVGLVETADLRDNVKITAHRGSSHKAPENTLAAIKAAIDDGADYAEIDVQETRDGIVVVMHDADFMRIAGVAKKIWEVDFEQTADMDIGSWFDEKFSDQRLATLQQAIDLAKDRIKLNIELKFNGHDQHLEERVASLITDNGFVQDCVVTSLDHSALMTMKKLISEIKTGAIVSAKIGNMMRINVDFLSLLSGLATKATVQSAHAAERSVHVWTINDEMAMHRMIERGVDNIITDKPDVLAKILKQRAEMSDIDRILFSVGLALKQF